MPKTGRIKLPWQNKPKKSDPYYHTEAWKQIRLTALQRDKYLCQYCKAKGEVKAGYIADHYLCRRLFPELEWELSNLKTACRTHDQIKRQLESGVNNREVMKQKLIDNGY